MGTVSIGGRTKNTDGTLHQNFFLITNSLPLNHHASPHQTTPFALYVLCQNGRSCLGPPAPPIRHTFPPQQPQTSTMTTKSQRRKRRGGGVSSLNTAIEALNLAKDISGIPPAQAVFGAVSALLTMIRVCFLFS